MPKYTFKFWEEMAWAAAIAALVFVLTGVTGLENTADLKSWGIALLVGSARAAAGAALAMLRKPTG